MFYLVVRNNEWEWPASFITSMYSCLSLHFLYQWYSQINIYTQSRYAILCAKIIFLESMFLLLVSLSSWSISRSFLFASLPYDWSVLKLKTQTYHSYNDYVILWLPLLANLLNIIILSTVIKTGYSFLYM